MRVQIRARAPSSVKLRFLPGLPGPSVSLRFTDQIEARSGNGAWAPIEGGDLTAYIGQAEGAATTATSAAGTATGAATTASAAATTATSARDVTTTARDATTAARDLTLGYRDAALGYRNSAEGWANLAASFTNALADDGVIDDSSSTYQDDGVIS